MPTAKRIDPPYAQIANHYRDQILKGALKADDRLPTFADIAQDWQVSVSTVARGIGQLSIEGYVRVLARGAFVEPLRNGSVTPRDQIARVRSAGSQQDRNGLEIVRAAELIRVPPYVADLLDIEPVGQVIRREWVTLAGRAPRAEPVGLHVSWLRPELAEQAPELLATKSIPGGPIAAVERATGLAVSRGEDHFHGRASDMREATALGIPVGTAILAGAYIWTTADGQVLEYGEFCLPPRRTLRYDYEVD
jgi:GntR family transcriptional regulator